MSPHPKFGQYNAATFTAQVQAVIKLQAYQDGDKKRQRELLGRVLFAHVSRMVDP